MIKVINCLTGKKEKISKKDFYLVDGIEFYKDKISCYYNKRKNFYINKKEFDNLFTTFEEKVFYYF